MPTSEGGYKQFPLEKLFQSANGNFDIQKVHFNDKGHNVISAGESNNGIVGKTDVAARVFSGNTITIDMFGNSYYQYEPYKMVTHARVFSLSPLEGVKMSERIGLYVLAQIKYFKNMFSYDNMCSWEKVRLLTIKLPVNLHGDIDFDYIEWYTRHIEDYCFRELGTYFEAAGFYDCALTITERNAINNLKQKINHGSPTKLSQLFEIKGTKSLDEGALEFIGEGINFVGRVNENNGVKGLIAMQDFEPNEPNTITATVIGNYKYVKFQEKTYYCSQNINKLTPLFEINHNVALFFVAHILKFTSTYNGQQGGYKLPDLQNHIISLPVTADGSIDYEFMENYINAIKKQTIARVKEYIEQEHNVVVEEPQTEQNIIPLVYPEYKPGFIPLYTLRAACGYFDEGQLPEEEGWVDASGLGFTPDPKRHFAVHAKGDSMLPKIKDGDLCIFEWYTAGSRNGEIVLTQSSEYDSEYGGRYTIKRYQSEKIVTDEGWQHTSVQLLPLNQDFDPIELDEFGDYRTIGIFKCVLN